MYRKHRSKARNRTMSRYVSLVNRQIVISCDCLVDESRKRPCNLLLLFYATVQLPIRKWIVNFSDRSLWNYQVATGLSYEPDSKMHCRVRWLVRRLTKRMASWLFLRRSTIFFALRRLGFPPECSSSLSSSNFLLFPSPASSNTVSSRIFEKFQIFKFNF